MKGFRWYRPLLAGLIVLGFGVSGMAAETATLKGKTVYKGGKEAAPQVKEVKVKTDEFCMHLHEEKRITNESILVNEDGTVRNVIVYIKKGLDKKKKYDPPEEKMSLSQKGCVFTPHVLTMMAGQTLVVHNNDPTLHNVHGLPFRNQEFNFGQPEKGMTKELKFKRQEIFKIVCDVHPWMSAYAGVFTHPFFALTGEDGTFEIKGLPPGEYEVAAWQERHGEVREKITLAAGETKEMTFIIGGKKKRKGKRR